MIENGLLLWSDPANSYSLEDAITLYENEYEKIFQDFRVSRSKRGGINIDEFIGKEVNIDDLQKFKA